METVCDRFSSLTQHRKRATFEAHGRKICTVSLQRILFTSPNRYPTLRYESEFKNTNDSGGSVDYQNDNIDHFFVSLHALVAFYICANRHKLCEH